MNDIAVANHSTPKAGLWLEDTTASTGGLNWKRSPGGRTADPVAHDAIQLLAVCLAGDSRKLAWPGVPEILPNVQITSGYVIAIEVGEEFVGHAGDAANVTSASAEVARKMVSITVHQTRPLDAPRTALGRRLRELRRRIVAGGDPLLDWDGLDREVRVRRGGRRD